MSELSDKFTEFCEEIARERYPDLVKEPHGLMRGFAKVFTTEDDWQEAVRRLRVWGKDKQAEADCKS